MPSDPCAVTKRYTSIDIYTNVEYVYLSVQSLTRHVCILLLKQQALKDRMCALTAAEAEWPGKLTNNCKLSSNRAAAAAVAVCTAPANRKKEMMDHRRTC